MIAAAPLGGKPQVTIRVPSGDQRGHWAGNDSTWRS
jgi:hypothetical protein